MEEIKKDTQKNTRLRFLDGWNTAENQKNIWRFPQMANPQNANQKSHQKSHEKLMETH